MINNDQTYSKKFMSLHLIILLLFNVRAAKAKFATAQREFCVYIWHDDCQTLIVCSRLCYLWPADGDVLQKRKTAYLVKMEEQHWAFNTMFYVHCHTATITII